MMYFKFWVRKPIPFNAPPGGMVQDESDCLYIAAETQDAAILLSEKVYPKETHLKLREITEADLPAGQEWL